MHRPGSGGSTSRRRESGCWLGVSHLSRDRRWRYDVVVHNQVAIVVWWVCGRDPSVGGRIDRDPAGMIVWPYRCSIGPHSSRSIRQTHSLGARAECGADRFPTLRYSRVTCGSCTPWGRGPNFREDGAGHRRAAAPAAAEARHVLVDTGQHYDRMMSEIFLEELGRPRARPCARRRVGVHAVQTARVMERIEPVIAGGAPDLVIVPGDVNSTLAVALVAVKLGIPLAHLESGLRSFDRTMPEEINRIVADQFSDYLFIHSAEASENLLAEGIAPERDPLRRQHDDRQPGGDGERFRDLDTAARFGVTPATICW